MQRSIPQKSKSKFQQKPKSYSNKLKESRKREQRQLTEDRE